jgi:sec-independent protein translocase protein TatA
MPGLTGWHFLIILVVVLLLFGATKLPALAKSVGQSAKIFRNEMKSEEPAKNAADAVSTPTVDAASDAQPSTKP